MPESTPTTPVAGSNDSHYRSINDFIVDTELMLNNTKANATILAKMTAAGYPVTDINNKLTQLADLRTLNETQAREYGEQFNATEAWQQRKAAYHPTYIDHVGLARIAFRRDKGVQNSLAVNEERAISQNDYIMQGLAFYDNALAAADVKMALANKGLTQALLEAGQSEFLTLKDMRETQQRESGQAQTATRNRDTVYEDLLAWEMDYRATAKIVLRESAELMEEIGIKQAS
jgi:hypothetical protein